MTVTDMQGPGDSYPAALTDCGDTVSVWARRVLTTRFKDGKADFSKSMKSSEVPTLAVGEETVVFHKSCMTQDTQILL